ncbi:DEAD/DEAH box helicase [Tuwongella immobilis]|uniref:Helicase ATP-binding domain-containing protein n=1 Tax=Tuwongella immobilis TaxID=692036 RepID=A0A6C2YKK7_9BACT|nr:DEAD/DEAH box helicase [Tuwongella immobilis]VIP01917.1 non-specific serine threonine protein kinase : Swi/snf family protein OS=Blastopirellula marina DSM 3645 GN=DSM3645_16475 PE=4 SV=1: SNF2_N: Helicase_C [Tuwongella immobilis]VTR99839.1 non-specific serine threonine protein kinase : Swi/snf family protein OS=Blastopirellula marina DSM 3645 GN=DSM3645_16475 PE=4 SV=1: SNF2_N: Helicase_C [Tuwongella immobilis]
MPPELDQSPEPETALLDLGWSVEARPLAMFDRPLQVQVRDARLLGDRPWTRAVGPLNFTITSEGWRFPTPMMESAPRPPVLPSDTVELDPNSPRPAMIPPEETPIPTSADGTAAPREKRAVLPRPTPDTVLFKDRLLYLLQPPLNDVFAGKSVSVPFQPFPYQLEGIAFLMPRHAALLADEMGLGKTMQTILSIRLMLHAGLVRRVLLVCPKPLMFNWMRELKLWAGDLPYEVLGGDTESRRAAWIVSQCPLKLINYEILTRDIDILKDERVGFDLVVIDEAQRIKNRDSKTAQAVRAIRRERSWALTGTPIENRPEDLVNLFAFIDPGRIPAETPPKLLPQLTSDCILRRTKDLAQSDMPPLSFRDLCLEMTPAQQEAYHLAEKEGVIRLNEMGETLTVQHVFQLVMRLKQICNFDPLTGASAKLEQLLIDMEEVAESGRKAIIFSQWVEPLEVIAKALKSYNPLQFHGKIPSPDRPGILDKFKSDPNAHVLLMSYGTGSVGLNLQFTNYVFLFDRWWNPAIEDQAINRAHRIGQKYPVTVTRFTTDNTIEKRIADVLDAKRKIFHDLLSQNGPPANMGLTEDDIFGLFDIKPPRGKK